MGNRIITEQEEQVYRLVSGDFDGLSVADTAEHLGISSSRVYQLLKSVAQKAPQLFPLLTKQEALALQQIMEQKSDKTIQDTLNITNGQLVRIVRNLRAKGRLAKSGNVTVVSYQNYMDSQLREKF